MISFLDFPLFQRLAKAISSGKTKIPGIKIQDTRMLRLMEVLLHGGSQLAGWRTVQIHEAIRAAFGLTPEAYTLTQLRYDLRKMKDHGLVERDGKRCGSHRSIARCSSQYPQPRIEATPAS